MISSRQRYRHTQTGWAIIVALIAVAAVTPLVVATIDAGPLPLVFGAALLLLMAMFATLTVVVDDRHLGFHFTFALIRKRIALADIRHYKAVRNPWYYGRGIHLYPGGVLYNVSGLQAVEILLQGGKRLRIGTDEPDAVVRAIEGVIGAPEPLSVSEEARVQSSTKKRLMVLLGILVLVLGASDLLVYLARLRVRPTGAWETHLRLQPRQALRLRAGGHRPDRHPGRVSAGL